MSVLRTPDERFANLPRYPFTPNYVQVETKGIPALRMHYVDAGPADAPTVVLVHGQPTWSFLYREVIHVLTDAGLRVIAPDHIGFGRSDKLTERTDYTFARHIDWLHGLITELDPQEITLVVQDWGGPIGFAVATRHPNRFSRFVIGNTWAWPKADLGTQAFVSGRNLGLQFHPEVTPEIMDDWVRTYRHELDAEGIDPEGLLEETNQQAQEHKAMSWTLLEGYLDRGARPAHQPGVRRYL